MKKGDLVRFFNPSDVVAWDNQIGLVLRVINTKLKDFAVNVYFPKENETYVVCASLLEVVN